MVDQQLFPLCIAAEREIVPPNASPHQFFARSHGTGRGFLKKGTKDQIPSDLMRARMSGRFVVQRLLRLSYSSRSIPAEENGSLVRNVR